VLDVIYLLGVLVLFSTVMLVAKAVDSL